MSKLRPPRNRNASCTGKIAYEGWAAAVAATKRGRRDSLSAYRCTFCHKWHLGGPKL